MASLFVRSRPTTNWAASTAYSLGDRRKATAAALGIHFEVTTAGTSHSSEPTWNTTVGGTTSDGTVTWTTRGSANTWVASTAYVVGDRVVATTSASAARQGYVYECTTAGTSGGSEPAWVTTTPDTSTTTDNTATWTLRKCSTWNNAHIKLDGITLGTGTGATAAGDIIYVSDEHTQTQATALTFNWPGTRLNPNHVICVNDTGDPASPTTLASTAAIQTTGSQDITLTTSGDGVCFNGIKFQAGDGASNASIASGGTSVSSYIVFENCLLEIRGTNASGGITPGANAGATMLLVNTPVKFAGAGQGIKLNTGTNFIWRNTASGVQGTAPTTLFPTSGGGVSSVKIHGVDLSAVTGSLVSVANTVMQSDFLLSNCKLGAGVAIPTGTHAGLGAANIRLINCDSGATNTNFHLDSALGTVDEELTIVRTGGASDGTTPVSWKMTTVATTPRFTLPLESFPIVQWNDNSGASKTLTVEIVHDSVTNLTDAEVWVEVEYLGTSAFPVSSFVNDAAASILATAVDQAASSVTWTTTGLTNPNKQKLSVSFTPQLRGPVRAVVYLAKASKTIYVDPLATIA
jgi:hypothetical protein